MNNFLSTNTAKTIYYEEEDTIAFCLDKNYSTYNVTYKVTLNDGGTITTESYTDTVTIKAGTYFAEITFSPNEIWHTCRGNGDVIAFVISAGNRKMQYYVTREKPNYSFVFRNAFNAPEKVSLIGVTKTKADVSRNIAKCAGQKYFYDTNIEKTFEIETAPLSYLSAIWLEQLATSPKVFVLIGTSGSILSTAMREILITKPDYSISDTDDEPNTITFAWQYANSKMQYAQSLSDLRLFVCRTFASEFDYTFK